MEAKGIVVKDLGEYVEVASLRASGCGTSCNTCSAKCAESKVHNVKVINTIGAKVGDRVSIEMNSKSVLTYMCLIYGIPLLIFLASVTISFYYFENRLKNYQLISLLIGLGLTAISYILINKFDDKFKNLKNNLVIKKD